MEFKNPSTYFTTYKLALVKNNYFFNVFGDFQNHKTTSYS